LIEADAATARALTADEIKAREAPDVSHAVVGY
jgi:hypothetical protein